MSSDLELVADGDLLFASMVNGWQNKLDGQLDLNAYAHVGGYSTTSGSWVDIDATNMRIDFTSKGGDILLFASTSFNATSNSTIVYYRWLVDDVAVNSERWRGEITSYRDANAIPFILTGYPAGTYEIALQWYRSTGTITADNLTFGVVEL